MKNKKTLLIIIFIFVLFMGGASVLYSRLGKMVVTDQLAVKTTQSQEQEEIQNENQKQEEERNVNDGQQPDQKENAEESQEQKTKAPDFVVYDIDGKEVRLSEYIGKPIVLNFWASWCGPCQMEMPDFHEKYLELGEDIHFLMVNMTDGSRETVEKASGYVAEKGYTFPVYYDTASNAAMIYGVYSLPTTYFIDAEGYVIAQANGAIDAETLQRGIDMIE